MAFLTHSLPLLVCSLFLVACETEPDLVFDGPPAVAQVSSASSSSDSSVSNSAGISSTAITEPSSQSVLQTETPDSSSSIPGSVLIRVPFTAQAPHANWDDPYQEACEEASLIMVHHFLSGAPLSPDIADRAIVDMVRWQEEHGYAQDVSIEETAQIARDYYDYNATVYTDVSIDNIKQLLAQGQPVIVPAAGRMLGNPYFSGEGPFYHMLVIVGYDDRDFITHDPGTRRGEGHRYRHQVLLDAIHDWTGVKERTPEGRKVMMTIQ